MSTDSIKGVFTETSGSKVISNPEFSDVSWTGEYPAPGGWVVSQRSSSYIMWEYFPETGNEKREVSDYVFGSGGGDVPYHNREKKAKLKRVEDGSESEFCLIVDEVATETYPEQPDDVVELEEWWVDVTVDLLESI